MAVIKLSTLWNKYHDDYKIDPDDLLYIVDYNRSDGTEASRALQIRDLIDYLFGRDLNLSSETDDINIIANINSESNPLIRYNKLTGKWQFSNDGINFQNFGSSGLTINGKFDGSTETTTVTESLNFSTDFKMIIGVDGSVTISLNIDEISKMVLNNSTFKTELNNLVNQTVEEKISWNYLK